MCGHRISDRTGKTDELVRLADQPSSLFFLMGGLGGCPQNLNRQAEGAEMGKKHRKRKPLLSRLEKDVAILSKHKFDDEDLEEKRSSLLRSFICQDELTPRQRNLVHKLAQPFRTKSKRIRVERGRETHYVYAISDGAHIKIGYAVDPKQRLSSLQTSNASELRLEETIDCQTRAAAKRLEKQIHRAGRKHHVRGEWFTEDIMRIFDSRRTA